MHLQLLSEKTVERPQQRLTPNGLIQLLQTTETGKEIIDRANLAELSEAYQLKLSEVIAKFHISQCKKTTANDLESYSLAVTTLFKSERKVNDNQKVISKGISIVCIFLKYFVGKLLYPPCG